VHQGKAHRQKKDPMGLSRNSSNAELASAPTSDREGIAPSEKTGKAHQVKGRIVSRKNAGRGIRSGVFFGGNAA
jgi:hypothetical protein